MNDTDRGGMTVSSLLVMGLTASVVIPVIAIIVLGNFYSKGVTDQTVVVYMVGVFALIVLLGVLVGKLFCMLSGFWNWWSGPWKKYIPGNMHAGDHFVRAMVIGDDEFAMLSMSLNTLFDNEGFGTGGGAAAPASKLQ